MAKFMDSVIEQVESTPPNFLADIAAAEERITKEGAPVTVHRVMAITVDLEAFNHELRKLKQQGLVALREEE